jgi:hypothetical protein
MGFYLLYHNEGKNEISYLHIRKIGLEIHIFEVHKPQESNAYSHVIYLFSSSEYLSSHLQLGYSRRLLSYQNPTSSIPLSHAHISAC